VAPPVFDANDIASIAQPLIVNRVNGADDRWSAAAAINITFCVSAASFGTRYAAVVTAMETAASRIADAAVRGERVAIFGDYDVDGATSAALLAWHLRHCGLDPLIHIPDRLFEGYGPNTDAVRALAAKGATLLVTVDCGTTSHEPLAEARKHPGLEQGMVPWYVMDPMYQRMVQLVGPERAAKEYMDFNMSVTPFSAGSSVPSEINRGTAANMMRQRGEYDIFKQYGGIAVPKHKSI
jgi:hypothetical protein